MRFILVSLTSGNSLPSSVRSLPRNCAGTSAGDDVGGYQFLAVRQDCDRLDNPLVTLVAPNSFADAAVSLKTPRAYLRCGGVPADPLRNARHQVILHCHPWVEMLKLLSGDHSKVTWSTSGPSPSTTHSPIAHSSPRRRGAGYWTERVFGKLTSVLKEL
jgi:hypothetical protein